METDIYCYRQFTLGFAYICKWICKPKQSERSTIVLACKSLPDLPCTCGNNRLLVKCIFAEHFHSCGSLHYTSACLLLLLLLVCLFVCVCVCVCVCVWERERERERERESVRVCVSARIRVRVCSFSISISRCLFFSSFFLSQLSHQHHHTSNYSLTATAATATATLDTAAVASSRTAAAASTTTAAALPLLHLVLLLLLLLLPLVVCKITALKAFSSMEKCYQCLKSFFVCCCVCPHIIFCFHCISTGY